MSASSSSTSLRDPLAIVVQDLGDQQLFRLTGSLDLATVEQFRDAICERWSPRAHSVGLDLGRVRDMDSMGLDAVLGLCRCVRAAGQDLEIRPGSRRVQRVFELCGLLETLPFEDAHRQQPELC